MEAVRDPLPSARVMGASRGEMVTGMVNGEYSLDELIESFFLTWRWQIHVISRCSEIC